MRRTRTIVGFVVRVVVLYALLMLAWLVVGNAYAAGFRTGCAMLFGSFGSQWTIRYEPIPDASKYADTDVLMKNARAGVEGSKTVSARYRGYVPTAVLIALVLSTPLPWPRRWRALLWGLLLINAIIPLREFLVLLETLSGDEGPGFFQFSAPVKAVLHVVTETISKSTISHFVIAVVVWIPATFRKGDWAALIRSDEQVGSADGAV